MRRATGSRRWARIAVLVAFASMVIAPQTLKMGGVSFAEGSRTAPYDEGQICLTPSTYGVTTGETCLSNLAATQTGTLTIGGQPAMWGGNPNAFVRAASLAVLMSGSGAFSIQARLQSASISVEFDLCMNVSEASTGLQIAVDCISHLETFRDLNVSGTSTVGTSYRVRVSLSMREDRCGVPCKVSGATAVSVLGFEGLPPGPPPGPGLVLSPWTEAFVRDRLVDLIATDPGYTPTGPWVPSVLRVRPGQIIGIVNAGLLPHDFKAGSPIGTGEQALVSDPVSRYVYHDTGAWFPLCGDSSLEMCDVGVGRVLDAWLYGRRTTIQINPSAPPGKYLFWCPRHVSMKGVLIVDTPTTDLEAPATPSVSTPAEGASVSTTGNSIYFEGTAEPDTAVTLEIVSGPITFPPRWSGRAFADSSGNWSTAWNLSITGYRWRPGDYVYRVAGTDAAGNSSPWETHTFKVS